MRTLVAGAVSSLALLTLGCSTPSPSPSPSPLPPASEDLGTAAEALTLGDWSQFPTGYQCMVAVQIFYKAKFDVLVPYPANAWDGDCAPLGACHIWVDSIPNASVWSRIPDDGSQEPTTYDMIVYPPIGGDPYGHIASVDHVTNGAIYVMDDNYCADNCQDKAPAPHTVSWPAYGWYHLLSLPETPPPPPACVPTPETCNGKDDDCDGKIDEDLVETCGSDVGVCKFGSSTCSAGVWGACMGGVGPTPEICNGLDDNCNGLVDEGEVCELDESTEAALLDLGQSTDVDGDGRADACALSEAGIACELASGHGFGVSLPPLPVNVADPAPLSVYSTLRLGDIDGDGRADVCLREPAGVSCWLSESHGFGREVIGPPLGDAAGGDAPGSYSTIRLLDVDGDGRADLCARTAAGFACYRSTGNAFAPLPVLEALSDAAGFSDVNRYATLRMGDIDGDGRADVCAREAAGMSCWRSGEHGFTERVVGPPWSDAAGWGAWELWSTIRIADVNGDGLADLCAREPDGFNCYLSDGAGFGVKVLGPALPDAGGWSRWDVLRSLRMGDLDGDGSADLCARGAGGVTCWLWSGHQLDREILGPALTDADGWTQPDQYRTLRLANVAGVNGDGRGALCGRDANGLSCWLFGEQGFGERILGPAWNDPAGWNAAPRFESIRVAGPARRTGAGSGAGGSSGSAAESTASPSPPAGAAAARPSSGAAACSAASASSSCRTGALPFWALAGAWLLARRRARRTDRSPSRR